jgi:hypothetical protein
MELVIYRTNGTREVITRDAFPELKEIYGLIGCEMVEGYSLPNGTQLWVDEEGRLNEKLVNPFFAEFGIVGDVLHYSHIDNEGECVGFDMGHAPVLTVKKMPADIFAKGSKLTIIRVGGMGFTSKSEVVFTGIEHRGEPVFTYRGKRTKYAMKPLERADVMVFRGHDIDLKLDSEVQKSGGMITMNGNAMFNFAGGTADEIRRFISEKQINPAFAQFDRIMLAGDGERTIPLYPDCETTSRLVESIREEQAKVS